MQVYFRKNRKVMKKGRKRTKNELIKEGTENLGPKQTTRE